MDSGKAKLEINVSAITENYKIFQNQGTSQVGASVKADCYGLGAKQIVPILVKLGCRDFFVANCDEGIFIRSILESNNSNIYVLSGPSKDNVKDFLYHNLIPVLNNLDQLSTWRNVCIKDNMRLPCIFHFDTGMHRLGIQEYELESFKEAFNSGMFDLRYIMSHLLSSEIKDSIINKIQLEKFNKIIIFFPNIKKSLANSGGAFLSRNYHFDLLRPGAGLYGINPAPYMSTSPIQHVIKLLAPIIHLQEIKPGESVGYNQTFKAQAKTIIATIAIGYADGLPVALSNKGKVFINSNPAPIVGRVSMDLTTIDVTHIPRDELFIGQQVEIMGPNCNIDKLASLSRTIPYEILTRLGNRFERIYTQINCN